MSFHQSARKRVFLGLTVPDCIAWAISERKFDEAIDINADGLYLFS
jgi:hypothetical protein